MAAEMVLPTWDNFSNGSWNYFLYSEPGRPLTILPWDLDDCLSFRTPPDADPHGFSGHADELSKLRVLMDSSTAWRDRFDEHLAKFRDGVYRDLEARTTYVCGQVRSDFETDPNRYGTLEEFDAECSDIRQRIRLRREYLLNVQ